MTSPALLSLQSITWSLETITWMHYRVSGHQDPRDFIDSPCAKFDYYYYYYYHHYYYY